jgi:hypothetical protein
MNEMMEGTYPWTVENGTFTVLHLKNATNKTVEAGVLILFDGGVYNPDKFKLQPYQTIDLDIQKVKDSKKPDVLGHVFPASATHGQLDWFQITPNTMIGRAEGTDVGAGIARSFSCGRDCCGNFWQGYNLLPNPMNGVVGGSGAFSATETYTDCFGTTTYYPGQQSSATSWSSNNTSVVTVNNVGQTSFKGAGLGTVVSAIFPIDYYNWNNSGVCTDYPSTNTAIGRVNVNPPDHLVVVGDGTGVLAGCAWVYGRQLAVNTVDVNGNPITHAYMQESLISESANTCGNGLPVLSSCQDEFPTLAEFVDNIGIHSCNVPVATCGYNIQYEWQWCSTGGAPINVGKFTDIVHNNQITINGNASPVPAGSQNQHVIPNGTVIRP